jgi:hypothetical protein
LLQPEKQKGTSERSVVLPEGTDLNGRYRFLLVLFAGGQAVFIGYSLARFFLFGLLPLPQ